jgi:hypothetical protein
MLRINCNMGVRNGIGTMLLKWSKGEITIMEKTLHI